MKTLLASACVLLSTMPVAQAKPAQCLVEVRGYTLIDGLCEFTPLGDGDFQVSSYENNGYASETFVKVFISQANVAHGFWNGSRYQPLADISLGTLIRSQRNRACWENRNTTICAW